MSKLSKKIKRVLLTGWDIEYKYQPKHIADFAPNVTFPIEREVIDQQYVKIPDLENWNWNLSWFTYEIIKHNEQL